MSNNIESKVVVVTGASSGLGETTARFLLAARATIGNHRNFSITRAIAATRHAKLTETIKKSPSWKCLPALCRKASVTDCGHTKLPAMKRVHRTNSRNPNLW
jgi:NAD(P)-dependent dehydrogenase (short-subunit alcohol dehydrogenase family)